MEHTKKRASPEQLETMLLELEKSSSMLIGRVGSSPQHTEQWQALTDRLNGMGVAKTSAKWQQAWRDLKSNTKKKAAKILEDQGKIHDGKPLSLTELEVRVLNLIGTDLADVPKAPEIDISNIAELNPLSSEERDSGSDGEEAFLYTPDMVTVYSARDGNDVTVKTEQGSPPHKKAKTKHSRQTKSHRIEFRQTLFGSERLRKETSELLQRLTSLEEGRQATEHRTSSALERIARALDENTSALNRHAAAADKQAQALERLTAVVDARYAFNSDT